MKSGSQCLSALAARNAGSDHPLARRRPRAPGSPWPSALDSKRREAQQQCSSALLASGVLGACEAPPWPGFPWELVRSLGPADGATLPATLRPSGPPGSGRRGLLHELGRALELGLRLHLSAHIRAGRKPHSQHSPARSQPAPAELQHLPLLWHCAGAGRGAQAKRRQRTPKVATGDRPWVVGFISPVERWGCGCRALRLCDHDLEEQDIAGNSRMQSCSV